jgi:hypothetical protein
MVVFYETLGIFLVALLAFFFSISPLAEYDLQLSAIFFIVYMIVRKLAKNSVFLFVIEVFIFVFLIFSAVFVTGGLASPVFFLLYILFFGFSIVLEPFTSILTSFILVGVFLFAADYTFGFQEMIQVVSLPVVAVIAQYFGSVQKAYRVQKTTLFNVFKSRHNLQTSKQNQKEQTLLFLTINLHKHFEDINERLENYRGDSDLIYLKRKMTELDKLVKQFKMYVESV